MQLTDSAAHAILEVIKKHGMNPENTFFEVKLLSNGALGIGFSRNPEGISFQQGSLKVSVDYRISNEKIIIDYGQVGDKKGIIFSQNC